MNKIIDIVNRQIVKVEQKYFFQKHVFNNMLLKKLWGNIKTQPILLFAGLIFLIIFFIFRAGYSLGEFIYYFFI